MQPGIRGEFQPQVAALSHKQVLRDQPGSAAQCLENSIAYISPQKTQQKKLLDWIPASIY